MFRTLRSLVSIAALLALSAPVLAQDKSATSIVQLPSAGGTVTREEGTFGLNTNTGSANFRLPLPELPTRGGFGPQITLAYNQFAGDSGSGLGIGWGFGVPAIVVNDDLGTAIPGTRPEGDFFSHLSYLGARLVFQGVDGGLWRYAPEYSEAHIEVLYHPGPFEVVTLGPTGELVPQTIPSGFEMLNPDGGRMIFSGDPAVAEGSFTGAAPIVTKWPLVLHLNSDREAVRYAYEIHGGRSYLDQISFAGGRSVYDFDLMDTRPSLVSHVSGSRQQNAKLYAKVTARFEATVYGQWCMGYVGRGTSDATVFEVRAHPDCLAKATQDLAAQIDPNSVNVLDQLRVLYRYGDTVGVLDDSTLKFPDIKFDYSSWTVAGLAGRDIVYEAPNMAFAGDIPPQNFELADINMDALVDIVRTSDSGAEVLLGEGELSAAFGTSIPLMLSRPTESGMQRQVVPRLADDRFHFADIFGDSFVDLVEIEDGLIHIYDGKSDGSFAYLGRSVALPGISPTTFTDGNGRFQDLNMDGQSDLVTTHLNADGRTEWQFLLNLTRRQPDGSYAVNFGALTKPFPFDSQDGQILGRGNMRIADVNGDRLPDFVVIRPADQGFCLYENQGNLFSPDPNALLFGDATQNDARCGKGRFTAIGGMQANDSLATMWYVDVNGDGILDFASMGSRTDQMRVWLGFGDGSFLPDPLDIDLNLRAPPLNSSATRRFGRDFTCICVRAGVACNDVADYPFLVDFLGMIKKNLDRWGQKLNVDMMAHWQSVLHDVWGIKAQLSPLDGEFDLNFLAAGTQDFVLKVMRQGCDANFIDLQCRAFEHIAANALDVTVPHVIRTRFGALFAAVPDESGIERQVWLLERVKGRTYAKFRPHSPSLLANIGHSVGAMGRALADFKHQALFRDFKWNLTQADWIADKLDLIADAKRHDLLRGILADFRAILVDLQNLPQTAIHNDVNDYNLLVDGSLTTAPHVTGIIDLGDMCASPRICDLAITCAYMVLGHSSPEQALENVVAGYHAAYPLTAAEVDMIWPLLRMRLAVSVVNSTEMALTNPDDPYVTISQEPAWAFLESGLVNPGLIAKRLRAACGLPVTLAAPRVLAWLEQNRGSFAPIMGADLTAAPMGSLSVENSTSPQNPFDLPLAEAALIGQEFEDDGRIWLGYYNEPRLIYTAPAFRLGPWKASNRRTVHLAIDAFGPAQTVLYAPMDAIVHVVENRTDHLDYGGVVILRHETPSGDAFFTLYGHLNPEVCQKLRIGQTLAKGEAFARLGDVSQSGGWAPHVHFQLALTTDGMGQDWPGVADPDEMGLWGAICPNPAALMNLPDDKVAYQPIDKKQILAKRQQFFGRNLKLSYADPVMLMRGWRHHLFDEWGRPYLDAYNNVPHVGHAHPRIQAVAADQLRRMNSNTRYLHPAQSAFAEKIISKMPDGLSVCFFVNSGSEANELALRLARAKSGGKDMITPDHGYHGNTTGAIDISAYKFNAKGGVGQPDWVQLVEVADDYRGSFRRDDPDRAEKFAALVDPALDAIVKRGGKLAGFIAETFPSVGGQIIPPKGYLAGVYQRIRAAGGVCIADEVQTGLGRLGDYYFGFEQQAVLPDIVVLGKPIGNGHPLGVVVTTRDIADAFAQGPEYFSTFGGSTLSCRMGKEVLDIVDDERLMENARLMGAKLLKGLRTLQTRHEVIGDVRGYGLFIGVDLVDDPKTRAPGTQSADYVKNRMREHRILIGCEGPFDNILKIRPPLTIDDADVEMILTVLEQILREVDGFRGVGVKQALFA